MTHKTKFLIFLFFFAAAALAAGLATVSARPVLAAPVVQDPSALTARVNKKISIGSYVPADLVSIGSLSGGSGFSVRQVVLPDLQLLMADMSARGLPVKVNSAYRSFASQAKLYSDGIAQNPKNSSTIAQAGHSEHQLGLAVDFGAVTAGPSIGFANTGQSAWLAANAYKYGFALTYPAGKEAITGYTYEPWHWRYIGRAAAEQWKQSGLVLDQFLASQPQTYVALSLVGQNIQTPGDPTVYYVNANGTKRGFIEANAFLSYGYQWGDILSVTAAQLAELPEAKVVKLQGDPTVYQFNADKTRQAIASAEAFVKLNYTWNDIVEINATELAGYMVGPIIEQ